MIDSAGHDGIDDVMAAWFACRAIPDTHTRDCYDLILGEVVDAWTKQHVKCAAQPGSAPFMEEKGDYRC